MQGSEHVLILNLFEDVRIVDIVLDRVSNRVVKGVVVVLEFLRTTLPSLSLLFNLINFLDLLVLAFLVLLNAFLSFFLLLVPLHSLLLVELQILLFSLTFLLVLFFFDLFLQDVGIALGLPQFVLVVGVLNFKKLLTSVIVVLDMVLELIRPFLVVVHEFPVGRAAQLALISRHQSRVVLWR